MNYIEIYRRSLTDPEGFWAEQAKRVDWSRAWDRVLDRINMPFDRWFSGAELNTCHNALDRHVASGRGDQVALIYDSPVTSTVEKYSYADLLHRTARLAGGLRARGVARGDRVLIYMPAVPEALVAMLACARLGAIHSVVFGGFAPRELATRIEDAKPKAILSASCGIEGSRIIAYKPMLDAAIDMAVHKPEFCAILQRPQLHTDNTGPRDIDWMELDAAPVGCVPVKATDPLYILYTSGTTGAPKGVVRDNGGHAVALLWAMENFYATRPGEVFWAASDIGWQVGHSFILYGPLMHGATTVLYEGKPVGTPDAGAFWRVINQHGVTALLTAPTAIRAIRREDPQGQLIRQHGVTSLRALYLAGERTDPDTLAWVQDQLGVPVVDHWWQTETGWPVAGNPLGIERFPVKPGSTTVPMPGWHVQCLDGESQEVPHGTSGDIAIQLPLPPGALMTLWNADDRYRTACLQRHPGYYVTGDSGYIDEEGYIFIMGRTDDVINVAGHRLSTGAMEEVLASHGAVAECAVIGVADQLKGQLPLGFIVLKRGADRSSSDIAAETIQLVRERIGAVASLKQVLVVDRLPKTRSGKILRGTMQKIADGVAWNMPATIEDPAVLKEIAEVLKVAGQDEAKPRTRPSGG